MVTRRWSGASCSRVGQCSQKFPRYMTTGVEEDVLKRVELFEEMVKSFKHQYDVALLAHRVTTEQLGGDCLHANAEDVEVYGQWWLCGLKLTYLFPGFRGAHMGTLVGFSS